VDERAERVMVERRSIADRSVTLGTLGERDVELALQPAQAGEPEDASPIVGSTWQSVDLSVTMSGLLTGTIKRLAPTVGTRTDGRALFYRGKVNGVAGASNSGKSWTALVAAVQELEDGHHVVYVDLEDDAAGVLERLLALGAVPDDILSRFHYLHPDESYGVAAATHLTALVEQVAPTLVVIDSTGESLALDGAKPNDDDDVARWFRRLPTRIARMGPAVVVLDHVVKADDGGMWPIGSQRKRAAISGAQYMQVSVKGFDRDTDGFSKLLCAKDRHGNYRQNMKVAELHITPHGEQDGYATLRAPDGTETSTGTFRPTRLMQLASEALHGCLTPPLPSGELCKRVTGQKAALLKAIDVLVAEGYFREEEGPRSARLLTSIRPYREADDRQGEPSKEREQVEVEKTPETGLTCSRSLEEERENRSLTGSRNRSGTGGNGSGSRADQPSCPCGQPLHAPESIEAGSCARCRVDGPEVAS
jgi:hypothetical protein